VIRRTLRALPTLLRVGVAETVAYRAEFIVWVLTTTLPLVMLGIWDRVAADGPFRGFTQTNFEAYFLTTLIVRNLTGSWVAWQISEEIRTGAMAMRLLRPLHPFVVLAATHIAAIPLRGLIALPFAVILLVVTAGDGVTHAPLQLALAVPSIVLGWMLTFTCLFAIGSAAFFVTRAMSLIEVYFALYALLSGYLLPLRLMPTWLVTIAAWTPFRFMLSAPVELLTLELTPGAALRLLGGQLAWLAILLGLAHVIWRAGVRRFEAVGS
jgi:viologen exporter family transport system permease protein